MCPDLIDDGFLVFAPIFYFFVPPVESGASGLLTNLRVAVDKLIIISYNFINFFKLPF